MIFSMAVSSGGSGNSAMHRISCPEWIVGFGYQCRESVSGLQELLVMFWPGSYSNPSLPMK